VPSPCFSKQNTDRWSV